MKQKICWDLRKRPTAIESKISTRPRPLTVVQAGNAQIPRKTPEEVEVRGLKIEAEHV